MRDKKEDEFDHGTITMKLLIQLLYAKKKKENEIIAYTNVLKGSLLFLIAIS
jgi:hypothetical protein